MLVGCSLIGYSFINDVAQWTTQPECQFQVKTPDVFMYEGLQPCPDVTIVFIARLQLPQGLCTMGNPTSVPILG